MECLCLFSGGQPQQSITFFILGDSLVKVLKKSTVPCKGLLFKCCQTLQSLEDPTWAQATHPEHWTYVKRGNCKCGSSRMCTEEEKDTQGHQAMSW